MDFRPDALRDFRVIVVFYRRVRGKETEMGSLIEELEFGGNDIVGIARLGQRGICHSRE